MAQGAGNATRSSAASGQATRIGLDRLEQHMPLLAQRELDHALRCELRWSERHLLVGDGVVVHPQSAVLDLATCFAVRSNQTCFDKCGENTEPGFELGPGDIHRWQGLRE